MKLTKEEQEELMSNHKFGKYIYVDEYEVWMDSHGVIKILTVITDGLKNYGFYFKRTSEEFFFEDQDLFKVNPREVIQIRWDRDDKKTH